MKVRLLTDRAGTGSLSRQGDVVDLPRPDAMTLLRSHQAEPVDAEQATTGPAEQATHIPTDRKRPTRRGRKTQ